MCAEPHDDIAPTVARNNIWKSRCDGPVETHDSKSWARNGFEFDDEQ